VLVSPDVRPDRTVVFRYWAPRAAVVQLSGDFMSGPPVAMTKDGQASGASRKARSSRTSTRTGSPLTEFELTARGAAAHMLSAAAAARRTASPWVRSRPRPGKTRIDLRAHCTTNGSSPRRSSACAGAIVYTPPGFDPKACRKYPVLVLLPGSMPSY